MGNRLKIINLSFFFVFWFLVWACAARWDGPRSPRKLTHFFTRKKKVKPTHLHFLGPHLTKKKLGPRSPLLILLMEG